MRIEILDSAEKDLINGFKFYESQSRGLGNYFLDSLFSDIESLYLYAGVHALHFGYHRLLSTIVYKMTSFGSMPFWIVAGVPHGLEIDFCNLRTCVFTRTAQKGGRG